MIIKPGVLYALQIEELPESLRHERGEVGQVRGALGPHAAVPAHEVAVVDGARLRPRVEPGTHGLLSPRYCRKRFSFRTYKAGIF